MTNTQQTHREFKERQMSLTVFGGFELLGGLFCIMTGIVLILLTFVPEMFYENTSAINMLQILAAPVAATTILGLWLLAMGIGSVFYRKWSRALMLATSWMAFVVGPLTFTYLYAAAVTILSMAKSQMSPHDMEEFNIFVLVLSGYFIALTVMTVVVPGIFVFFYTRKSVRATCELHDKKKRWTDGIPQPVLILFVIAFHTALVFPFFMWSCHWFTPFFGQLLKGAQGMAFTAFITAALAYVTWGCARLDKKAWWAAVILCVSCGGSFLITLYQKGLVEICKEIYPDKEFIEQIKAVWKYDTTLFIFVLIPWIVLLLFILWTRIYFRKTPHAQIEPIEEKDMNEEQKEQE